ncbi:hypothetical protein CI610_02095 [invertebrate metagenome]|uniref:DUF2782 domain-containing protein n=1 Tax=invertebrate metagenome TaxID=1711999 RepID=A0A2H9T6Y2_9ZZZZ
MKYLTLTALMITLSGCTSFYPKPDNHQTSGPADTSSSAISDTKPSEPLPRNLSPQELERRDDTSVHLHYGKEYTYKEYKVGGILYGIQVIPKVGPPYFLVYADNPDYFMRTDRPGMLIPSWKILQWK